MMADTDGRNLLQNIDECSDGVLCCVHCDNTADVDEDSTKV